MTFASATYAGQHVALRTRHGKEQVLEPLFVGALDVRFSVVRDIDTDTLGTFTRDVARPGSQLVVAREKARLAAHHRPGALGLGSEGAFLEGPFGMAAWNLEIVVLRDPVHDVEIVGRARGPSVSMHETVSSAGDLERFAHAAGFPSHGLVVRPDHDADPHIHKDLTDWVALELAFERALAASSNGKVFVENDLRAHRHPTRMALIERAGRDLVARMSCACPACGTPGYGLVARVPGLPCEACGSPTQQPMAERGGVREVLPPRAAPPS